MEVTLTPRSRRQAVQKTEEHLMREDFLGLKSRRVFLDCLGDAI